MKKETAELLQKYTTSGNMTFAPVDEGIEVKYNLSDAEILELVEAEYGNPVQDVNELFTVIIKNVVKMALENVKE